MIYQATNQPFTSATAAQYIAWATAIGQAMTTFGWSAVSGHGEVVASGTGGSYTWTNVASGPGATAIQSVQAYTFKGAWVSGTTYVGANTANSAAEVDVVTSSGLTYVHITASSSSTTPPASDTTNWMPFNFEIWKSTGSMSTDLPIYMKVVYPQNSNDANAPAYFIMIGTGVDINGNLTGTIPFSGTAPTYIAKMWQATAATSSTFESDFSGTSDTFAMALWKTQSGGNAIVLAIDRARTATGALSSAYFYVAAGLLNAASLTPSSGIKMNSLLGSGVLMSDIGRWACVPITTLTATGNFGAVPSYAVFPYPGYMANPLLQVMCFKRGDTTEGQIIPVWMYGASHNYLIIGNSPASLSPDGISSSLYPAILWE